MANPAVTYTFVNGNVADASQVNQNFTDLINGLTDGTKSINVDAITAAGQAIFNGNTTIGNAASDTCTINSTTSFNLGLSPNAKAGTDADTTMTITSNKFTVVTCTAARVYKLPTTSIKTGDTYTFINRATNDSYRLNLQASSDSGTTYVDWIVNGKITVMALQDTPTAAAHWATVYASSGFVSYTPSSPTISGVTTSGNIYYYKRSMSFIDIWAIINITSGASDNIFYVSITPDGTTIDTTLVSAGNRFFGTGWLYDATLAKSWGFNIVSQDAPNNGTTMRLVPTTGGSLFVGSSGPITFNSGDVLSSAIRCPISEWSLFN